MVGLPWAADSCPWVGRLRTVLPLPVKGVMGCEKNGLGRKGLGGNGASRLKDERRLNAREEEEVSVY
jgi:hypothetical protein